MLLHFLTFTSLIYEQGSIKFLLSYALAFDLVPSTLWGMFKSLNQFLLNSFHQIKKNLNTKENGSTLRLTYQFSSLKLCPQIIASSGIEKIRDQNAWHFVFCSVALCIKFVVWSFTYLPSICYVGKFNFDLMIRNILGLCLIHGISILLVFFCVCCFLLYKPCWETTLWCYLNSYCCSFFSFFCILYRLKMLIYLQAKISKQGTKPGEADHVAVKRLYCGSHKRGKKTIFLLKCKVFWFRFLI